MTLKLHNTLTGVIDTFTPLSDGKVTLYSCGPTVYDYPHVGNWASFIYWDILVRTLIASGYEVERVMNLTDVGHLVSDADEAVCNAFGVIQPKKLYGREYVGIVRSTFLIDPDGVVRQKWQPVKVPGHAQAVLDALKAARAK